MILRVDTKEYGKTNSLEVVVSSAYWSSCVVREVYPHTYLTVCFGEIPPSQYRLVAAVLFKLDVTRSQMLQSTQSWPQRIPALTSRKKRLKLKQSNKTASSDIVCVSARV